MYVSVLYREPKVLKHILCVNDNYESSIVSVLYREPKVLKQHIKY